MGVCRTIFPTFVIVQTAKPVQIYELLVSANYGAGPPSVGSLVHAADMSRSTQTRCLAFIFNSLTFFDMVAILRPVAPVTIESNEPYLRFRIACDRPRSVCGRLNTLSCFNTFRPFIINH